MVVKLCTLKDSFVGYDGRIWNIFWKKGRVVIIL